MFQIRLPTACRLFAILARFALEFSYADPCLAGDAAQPSGVGSKEIWVGADAGAHNWLVYSGTTYAPFDDIHGDGLRLRSTAGYGQYSYQWDVSTRVKVTKTTADILVGYQQRFGALTAKAFIGAALLGDSNVLSAQTQRANMSFPC